MFPEDFVCIRMASNFFSPSLTSFLREPGIQHTIKLSPIHTGPVGRKALIFQTAVILICFPSWPSVQVPELRTEPSLTTPVGTGSSWLFWKCSWSFLPPWRRFCSWTCSKSIRQTKWIDAIFINLISLMGSIHGPHQCGSLCDIHCWAMYLLYSCLCISL